LGARETPSQLVAAAAEPGVIPGQVLQFGESLMKRAGQPAEIAPQNVPSGSNASSCTTGNVWGGTGGLTEP
jgi:hypothetical protein